ncbi:MAG: hypothetical protein NTX76_05675 [Alphaproteobacteria bacterium]|nr:hypothetical protein [Alphaproteobacteria bacterium]
MYKNLFNVILILSSISIGFAEVFETQQPGEQTASTDAQIIDKKSEQLEKLARMAEKRKDFFGVAEVYYEAGKIEDAIRVNHMQLKREYVAGTQPERDMYNNYAVKSEKLGYFAAAYDDYRKACNHTKIMELGKILAEKEESEENLDEAASRYLQAEIPDKVREMNKKLAEESESEGKLLNAEYYYRRAGMTSETLRIMEKLPQKGTVRQ